MDLILQHCDNRGSTDGRHGGVAHLRIGPVLSLDWLVLVYGPQLSNEGVGREGRGDDETALPGSFADA